MYEDSKNIEILLKDNHLSEEAVSKLYDQWSSTYEKDLDKIDGGYHAHELLVSSIIPHLDKMSKSAKLLDVGAGTGLLGQQIKNLGFTNIDGLDGSRQMLEEAKKKDVYQNYLVETIRTEKISCIDDCSYDCLVTSGTFTPNHLSTKHLPILIRTLKTGGLLALIIRSEFLETCDEFLEFETSIKELVDKNVVKLIKTNSVNNYYNNKEGKIYILEKC